MSTAKCPRFKGSEGSLGSSRYRRRISKVRASLDGKEIHVLIHTLKHVVVVSWLLSQGDGAIDAKTGGINSFERRG